MTGLILSQPTPTIDQLICLGSYDIPVLSTAIQRLKYSGGKVLAQPLAYELSKRYSKKMKSKVLIPVPLHPSRERERGFNQSTLLVSAVRRIKKTQPQVTLTETERTVNVHDAFALAQNLEPLPKRGIIVDDVFTTGATMSEVACVLHGAGMKHITALTIAKG
jgi:ComF family protein